ncbi:MAG: GWxTD domain-containing protein [Acidobacteriota bacterium]|nr:GWxTD domain-containing protein [Acidobacteriota bacterium]
MRKSLGIFSVACAILMVSCALYKVPKSLDPESKEFISKARYIISKEDHKAFLALPASDREAFIEKFWKDRDPTPETDVNEFKNNYLARIEEANRLFKEGSTPGWLGDRGKYYILLGRPDNRETYPRGASFYDKPREVWYYGFFPIIFVDDDWSGNYRIDPYSVAQISEINKTQAMLMPKKPAVSERDAQDFSLETRKTGPGEVLLQVSLPFSDIWFEAEGDAYTAFLELTVEILDSDGKKAWSGGTSCPLSVAKGEFEGKLRETHVIEVPVKLDPGKYTLNLTLQNGRDGAKGRKKAALII